MEGNTTPHLIPTTFSIIVQLIVICFGDILQTHAMQQMLTEGLAGRYSISTH